MDCLRIFVNFTVPEKSAEIDPQFLNLPSARPFPLGGSVQAGHHRLRLVVFCRFLPRRPVVRILPDDLGWFRNVHVTVGHSHQGLLENWAVVDGRIASAAARRAVLEVGVRVVDAHGDGLRLLGGRVGAAHVRRHEGLAGARREASTARASEFVALPLLPDLSLHLQTSEE